MWRGKPHSGGTRAWVGGVSSHMGSSAIVSLDTRLQQDSDPWVWPLSSVRTPPPPDGGILTVRRVRPSASVSRLAGVLMRFPTAPRRCVCHAEVMMRVRWCSTEARNGLQNRHTQCE